MHASLSPGRALAHAFDFTAWVWRRAWGAQALAAVGPALMFVAAVAALPSERAGDLLSVGTALTLVAIAPLVGALLRLRLGGEADAELGPAGLQMGKVEGRLVVLVLAALVASVGAWLPMVAVAALILVLFRDLGLVELAGIGPTPWSFALVALALAVMAAAHLYALVRLSLLLPIAVKRTDIDIGAAWRLTAGSAGALAAALAASFAPAMLIGGLGLWLDRLAGFGRWAWEDAAVAGGLLAVVFSFVQAPLTLGVVGAFFLAETCQAPPKPLHARRLEKTLAALGV